MTRQQLDAAAFSEFVAARSGSLFRTAYLVVGDYHLAHSARADLLRRLNERDEAVHAYQRALSLTTP